MSSYSSLIVVCVVLLVLGVEGGLTLNKKCGEKLCGDKEFCSPFDNICRPCESVCELGSHNYQEEMCQKDCQDYLHDRLYVKRNDQSVENLQEGIARLYQLLVVVLTVCALILLIVVSLLTYAFLRARKQNGHLADKIRKKLATINALNKENNNKGDGGDSEAPKALYKVGDPLRLDIVSAQHGCPHHGSTPATASTALSVGSRPPRYPAEDTALEYGGYDNAALAPSPVFDANNASVAKRESSF